MGAWGVGSATEYVITSPYYWVHSDAHWEWPLIYCSLSDCFLHSVAFTGAQTCNKFVLSTTTWLVLFSGLASWNIVLVDMYLPLYEKLFASWGSWNFWNTSTNCARSYYRTDTLPSESWLQVLPWFTVASINTTWNYWGLVQDDSAVPPSYIWSYSWTIYWPPPTPPTIIYNGISLTGFAGSNIYINGIIDNPTYSWSDIVFNVRSVFRALLRF